MRIHLIAIGGSAMHNLAIALKLNSHLVSGSDDEIYNPSKDRLEAHDLLPERAGWDPDRITTEIDAIILGMHARKDNPELNRAVELGLPIYSYPEFLSQHSENKTRIVVTGSHGKTTTTAMIMHVLKCKKIDFDYLVGAQITGFQNMVRLSNAPLIVIEGDEYLSSPLDRRPKMLHYKPHLAVITGIAWDHINVFPTFENYLLQFDLFLDTIVEGGKLFYYANDSNLAKIVQRSTVNFIPYQAYPANIENGKTFLRGKNGFCTELRVFGSHNLQNLMAAFLICSELGIGENEFLQAIASFEGASKRLQLLKQNDDSIIWLDFAHAPSKVKATIDAAKTQYPDRQLVACLELHTFSSLNRDFLANYAGSMEAADEVYIYFDTHTLEMKRLPNLDPEEVKQAFKHSKTRVVTRSEELKSSLEQYDWRNKNLLLMSSGNFGGLEIDALSKELLENTEI